MRKWVKEELRVNPLAEFLVWLIAGARKNKNNLFVALAVVVIAVLFTTMTLYNKHKENVEVSKLFTFAQNDFDRFNYEGAIEKLEHIENTFKSSKLIPQVLYYKGISHYKLGELDKTESILKECLKISKNKIRSEVSMSLAAVYEENSNYEEALKQYMTITDNDYLKPEALAGIARIYEIENKPAQAIEYYEKLHSHYMNTYWSELAESRLSALKPDKTKTQEILPDLSFE